MNSASNKFWIFAWMLFATVPLLLALLGTSMSMGKGIDSYEQCIRDSQSYLPVEIVGTCCVIKEKFESQLQGNVMRHEDRVLIPYSDYVRVLWNRAHSLSAVFIFLFLTPNLLFLFSLFATTARDSLRIVAIRATGGVYAMTLIWLLISLLTFRDS